MALTPKYSKLRGGGGRTPSTVGTPSGLVGELDKRTGGQRERVYVGLHTSVH